LRLLVFLLEQRGLCDKRKEFIVEKIYLITPHFCKDNTVFQNVLTTSAVNALIIYFATFLLSFNKGFLEIIEGKNGGVNFLEVVSTQEHREWDSFEDS
jgi:hypothetical protein